MFEQYDILSAQGVERRSTGAQLGLDIDRRAGSEDTVLSTVVFSGGPLREPLLVCHAKHRPLGHLKMLMARGKQRSTQEQ